MTDRQTLLLSQYSKIREKYLWHEMEPIFMYSETMEDAWKKASSHMATEEVNLLREAFEAFKETFDKEWQSHQYLSRRKKAFDEIFYQNNIEQAFEEVMHFHDSARNRNQKKNSV